MTVRRKRIMRRAMREQRTEQVADALREALGSDVVHKAVDSDLGEPRFYIPSGVPELDNVLHRDGKGWPGGRIIEAFGGEATAKTAIGYALIAKAQEQGATAVLYPTEGNVDDWLMSRYGVDRSRLVIADDPTVEGVFSSFRKAMRAVGKRGALIAMIDSVADLTTKAELEDEDFNRDRAAQVRSLLLSKAFRKLAAEVPRYNVILFCVNQVRDAVDSMYASKPKPPGGWSLRFHASVRLRLENKGRVKRTRKGKTYVAGIKLKLTSEKNRLAAPFQEGDIVLDFEHGLFSAATYTEDLRAARKRGKQ